MTKNEKCAGCKGKGFVERGDALCKCGRCDGTGVKHKRDRTDAAPNPQGRTDRFG